VEVYVGSVKEYSPRIIDIIPAIIKQSEMFFLISDFLIFLKTVNNKPA
jgi:hypothetical protein